jgi:hypothetical protein
MSPLNLAELLLAGASTGVTSGPGRRNFEVRNEAHACDCGCLCNWDEFPVEERQI